MAKKIKAENEKTTENALATVQASALTSAAMGEMAAYGNELFSDIKLDVTENKELFSNDIIIPKIWLVQAISELRKQKKADEGDFVDSLTGEILSEVGTPLRFIVIKTFKRWQTFEVLPDGKRKFMSSEIMVYGKNHDLKYDDVLEGKKIVRRQVISAYVLIERDAIKGINKPYIIDFASSSKYAGRILVSDIATLNNKGLPSFTGIFEMTSEEESFKDNQTAFVKKLKFFGFVPKSAITYLKDVYTSIESIQDQIVIDDNDIISEASTATAEHKVTGAADIASEKI